ncbi:MAG TPA: PA2169 family four-helix-bundle protein [Pyrinomonadaceae bacterium]|jgi:uncharacterized protein (TIGR02284 family)
MTIDNDNTISTLNNLIETCRDGQNGFQAASDGVNNSELKKLFLGYSQQRAQFVGDLQNEVRRLGGDPEQTGSIAASLHRGWMDIKAAVTGKDEGAIIAECERGEDSAVRNYKDALEQNLPENIRSLVQSQYAQVQEAHDRVRTLERASGASS